MASEMHELWELCDLNVFDHLLRVLCEELVSEIFRHRKYIKVKAPPFVSKVCEVSNDCYKLMCLECKRFLRKESLLRVHLYICDCLTIIKVFLSKVDLECLLALFHPVDSRTDFSRFLVVIDCEWNSCYLA